MNMRAQQEHPNQTEGEERNLGAATESREQAVERLDRDTLGAILELDELDPATSLEVVANYDRDDLTDARLDDMRLITADFGLDLDSLDSVTRNELVTLQAATEKIASEGGKAEVARAMNELMREKLTELAFARVDGLYKELVTSKDTEDIKTKFREVMKTFVDLAQQMPPELEVHDKTWTKLYDRLLSATSLKNQEGVMPQVAEALKDVISEFEGEIEDEYVKREMKRLVASGQVYYVEDLIAGIYGRSSEDLEEIKVRNREEVVAEIMRMQDEREVSVETLVRLYAINNRGIVPKESSRFRQGNASIGFGKRVGLMPEDLVPEIEAVIRRAEVLMIRDAVKGVSKPLFEIAVAKLHNDILDIHPFPDRNGSTALLFIEFMMSKKGYVPDTKRQKGYYRQLLGALGNNPLAIGLVSYEHYKIHYVPGYYESEAIAKDKDKGDLYKELVDENVKDDETRKAEYKKERRAQKFKKSEKKP